MAETMSTSFMEAHKAAVKEMTARDFGERPKTGAEMAFENNPLLKESGDSRRKDAGKPGGFYLIPPGPLTELAALYKTGAAKYSPRGWEAGMEWSRVVDPMFRHLLKWIGGETHDQVDGQHHLAAVAWACFALMEYERTHPEMDDVHG